MTFGWKKRVPATGSLRGTITRILHALVEHDVSTLPVADNLRVTEDAIEKPLGSDKLTAREMFKIHDGQIHVVEAYIRLFPPELDLGGWPVVVSQPD